MVDKHKAYAENNGKRVVRQVKQLNLKFDLLLIRYAIHIEKS